MTVNAFDDIDKAHKIKVITSDFNVFKKLADAWSILYPQKLIKCTTKTGMPAHAFVYLHNPEEYYSADDDKPLVEVLAEWLQWFTKTAQEYAIENRGVNVLYKGDCGEVVKEVTIFGYLYLPTQYIHVESNRPFVELLHEWDVKRNQVKKEVKMDSKTFKPLAIAWANKYPDALIVCNRLKLFHSAPHMKACECTFVNDAEEYYSVEHNKLLVDVIREWCKECNYLPTEYIVVNGMPFLETVPEQDDKQNKNEQKMLNGYESLPKVWGWDEGNEENAIECVLLRVNDKNKYKFLVLYTDEGSTVGFTNISETKPEIQTVEKIPITQN